MKYIYIGFLIFLLTGCSKPKTVFICGDHVCVNKTEAEQYFEENLSIEVKILDKKIKREINLVELNLNENKKGKKQIILSSKSNTNKDIKTLSNEEIIRIKKNIKNKEKIAQKIDKENNIKLKIKKKANERNMKQIKDISINNNISKKRNDVVDVCTILEKCSIDEISKYLLEQGIKKNFPNITARQ